MQDSQLAVNYTQDQRDCLQEICNVATGLAADVLARKLNTFVTLPIPAISIVDVAELSSSLEDCAWQSRIYAVSQHFYCEKVEQRVNGVALMISPLSQFQAMATAGEKIDTVGQNICLPMIQACLQALSEQWQMSLYCDPVQCINTASVEHICASHTQGWHKVLLVEMNHQMEDHSFNGDLLLLFPDQAIITIAQTLDELLAS